MEKREGKRPLGRPRGRLEANIRGIFKKIGSENVVSINIALVNSVMNLWVS